MAESPGHGGDRGRSWLRRRELLRIELAPDAITLVQPATGDGAPARHGFACPPPGGDDVAPWRGPLAALEPLLRSPERHAARVAVVLSNHFVRYLIVPWRDDLGGAAERQAFVRHCFTRLYGARAESWELRVSETRYGAAAIASAVEPELLAALRAAIAAAGARLVSIDPLLAAAFNHARPRIDAGRYWFAVAEPGRLCTAHVVDDAWRQLRCQHLDADWPRALPRLLAREQRLAEDPADEEPLFLHAPALTGTDLLAGSWTPAGLRLPAESGLVAVESASTVAAVPAGSS